MEKLKAVEKGYTITVTSWENDLDNYKTEAIVVKSIELAKAYYDLMQLCTSKNNQGKGVVRLGNSESFSKEQISLLRDFFLRNTVLLDESDNLEDLEYIDVVEEIFYNLTNDLLGGSEDYCCRVMENCVITYSPKDIYVEQIEFMDQ